MPLGQKLFNTASRNTRVVVPQVRCVVLTPKHVFYPTFLPLYIYRGRSVATVQPLEYTQQHVNKGLSRLSEDIIVKGEGPWVTMRSGRKLLDFTCGIGVTNLGAFGELYSSRLALTG
jgi:hypothetical protein